MITKRSFSCVLLAGMLFAGCGGTDTPMQPGSENNSSIATVKIAHGATSYALGESVVLNSQVTHTVKTYAWSENGTVLGTEAQLNKNDFSADSHTIKLTVVTEDGQTLTDTFTFSVVDTDVKNFTAKVLTDSSDHVLVDNVQKRMWVSEANESKNACLAIPSAAVYAQKAETFCQNLVFAGFDDWQTPSTSQLADFITRTIATDTLPGYPKPCPRLLSKNDQNDSKAVVTRYGNDTAGMVTDVTYPIGLRCVRSYTQTAPVADAGDDITVDYQAEFSFDASRSRDNDGQIVKYEWIFGGNVLNADTSNPIYTRDATQPAGDYTVLLRVTDDDNNTAEDTVIVHVQ